MMPTDDLTPAQLVGKQVLFKQDADHGGCWHYRQGLKTGVVLRVGQTLAQKAELLGQEELSLPESLPPDAHVPRLWVRADPCPSFPRGCEVAVEKDCLLVVGPEGNGKQL